MESNLSSIILKRVNRVSNGLVKNNMAFYYAETKEEVPSIVASLLSTGDVVATGGSVTLKQCGVLDLLRSDKYKYLDREAVGSDSIEQLYRASFSANAYLCSANAITENGELYNVDGNSNRIAAIAYGPKSVIIVAGYNKIVKNIDEAVKRVKSLSAPANSQRLNCATYCYEKGECISLNKDSSEICSGCESDSRVCCNYLISAHQRHKDRIKVIIVGEQLGY
jgi:L-lactate utilization protein LutB